MNADYIIPVAPFLDVVFYITDTFWSNRGGTPHRGLDIDPSGQTNYPLYSMLDGKVIAVGNTSSAGNYIIIKDTTDPMGTATRYLHMKEMSFLRVGDIVRKFDLVGYEGTTGQSTGIHLHLEMKYLYNSENWVASNVEADYINPASWLGVPNQKGISMYCDGSPQPITIKKKSRYPFVLYARELRGEE